LSRQAMIVRISAGSRITAITDIVFAQTGTTERIDIVDQGQKRRPSLPAIDSGHLGTHWGFPRSGRLCGLPAVPIQGSP
jgi:hypothetical protein